MKSVLRILDADPHKVHSKMSLDITLSITIVKIK
jgi:hypothetical protein